MKKFVVFIIFCISMTFAIAEEQNTLDQRIMQKCNVPISQYRANKTVDNEIIATECAYNAAKQYNLDVMPIAKNLSYLYATKYQNSANNPQYLDKMYKYSFIALRSGSKDPVIAESAVFQAIIKQNIKDLDYAYELLCNIAPQKAQQIRADVVDARSQIQKQNETNGVMLINGILDGLTSRKDELTGNYMTQSEIRARNEALLKSGTSYEQLIMQKRQVEAQQNQAESLNNINNSLNNINSNLNGLRYGY